MYILLEYQKGQTNQNLRKESMVWANIWTGMSNADATSKLM